MTTKPNDLSAQAQAVWEAKTVLEKQHCLREMIGAMKFKSKTQTFHQIAATTNLQRLDKFAADLMLCDTDRVINRKS